jgi:hypothetical protein
MWLHRTEARWDVCVYNVVAIISEYGINTPVPSVKARWNRLARKSFGHDITDQIIEYNE